MTQPFRTYPCLRYALAGIYFLLLSTGAISQNNCLVSGQLNGFSLTEKTGIVINRYNGYNYVLQESIQAGVTGAFNFKSPLSEGFYQLSIPSKGIVSPFYCNGVKNVTINVFNADLQMDRVKYTDEENITFNELQAASKHLEITLNTINEEFDPRQLDSFYLKKLPDHNSKVQQAYGDFNAAVTRIKAKYPTTLTATLFSSFYKLPLYSEDQLNSKNYDNQDAYMRDHFFDLWKLDDERITRLPEVKLKLEKYFRFFGSKKHAFLIKKCDEIISLTKNEKVKTYLASLLIDFFTQVKENDVVAHVVETNLHGCLDGVDLGLINFTQNNLRGTKVSELELPAEDLQPVKLSSVYSKSKVTLLYFYSSDCIHCQNFHPIAKGLKEKYGKDLAVYAVCMEDDEKKWRDAITEFGMNFNNVLAKGEQRKQVKQLFNIKFTPAVFLLNTSGEILDKDLTSEDIRESLAKFLKP